MDEHQLLVEQLSQQIRDIEASLDYSSGQIACQRSLLSKSASLQQPKQLVSSLAQAEDILEQRDHERHALTKKYTKALRKQVEQQKLAIQNADLQMHAAQQQRTLLKRQQLKHQNEQRGLTKSSMLTNDVEFLRGIDLSDRYLQLKSTRRKQKLDVVSSTSRQKRLQYDMTLKSESTHKAKCSESTSSESSKRHSSEPERTTLQDWHNRGQQSVLASIFGDDPPKSLRRIPRRRFKNSFGIEKDVQRTRDKAHQLLASMYSQLRSTTFCLTQEHDELTNEDFNIPPSCARSESRKPSSTNDVAVSASVQTQRKRSSGIVDYLEDHTNFLRPATLNQHSTPLSFEQVAVASTTQDTRPRVWLTSSTAASN